MLRGEVRRAPTRKALVVGALLLAALVIRVGEVQRTAYRPVYDAGSYLTLASEVAHIGDYSNSHAPGTGAGNSRGPSAYFAPGFPYFLAAVDVIGGHTTRRDGAIHPARLAQALLGTVAVGLVGLVALEAFGETVGLIALALAALYPALIELSGTIVAENLMTPLVLAAVWAALRAGRSPHPYRWIAAAGLATGLAILAHVNSVVIVLPLAFAAWRARRSLIAPALLLAIAALAVTPWTVRNAIVLHHFVPVTDETGITLVGTYNPASAAYKPVPYKWRIFFRIPGERPLIRRVRHLTEVELSDRLQGDALRYIGHHPLAPLAVIYHNTLRLLELEGSFAWRASAAAIDLPEETARVGVFGFWVICALALAGAFTRAARAAPRWLWGVPLLLWLSVAVINVETPRFREPIDPFLIMLGSCALAEAFAALRRRVPLGTRAPIGGDTGTAISARASKLVEMVQRLTRPVGDARQR
jgi:4-amino-4-deoxy-L-arabinose transferase-like glycosyltransferase